MSEAPFVQRSRRTSEHRTLDSALTKPSRMFNKGPLTNTLWHGDSKIELPAPALPARLVSSPNVNTAILPSPLACAARQSETHGRWPNPEGNPHASTEPRR